MCYAMLTKAHVQFLSTGRNLHVLPAFDFTKMQMQNKVIWMISCSETKLHVYKTISFLFVL